LIFFPQIFINIIFHRIVPDDYISYLEVMGMPIVVVGGYCDGSRWRLD